MKKIAVIGAGSFGTALAVELADKGHQVRFTTRGQDHIDTLRRERSNERFLPGVKFPDNIVVFDTVEEAQRGVDLILFAVPAQNFRKAFSDAKDVIEGSPVIVNVAKGIEKGTLKRMSQIAKEIRPDLPYVTLSGPSHAEEVGRFLPTTVAAASEDIRAAEFVQSVFITDRFRVYTNDDVAGVELGGSLKNIIALGAGISDGIGFGDNAKAALMTRGITEMIRLGIVMGAKPETFSGLTGVGDLIVTCTSMHSRNRRCGIMIGEGVPIDQAVEKIGMVVEGIHTVYAAEALAKKHNVEMPITRCIYECLEGKITAAEAVDSLMNRSRKNEMNF